MHYDYRFIITLENGKTCEITANTFKGALAALEKRGLSETRILSVARHPQ